ncbi:hypothetical protein PAXINDRAFT_115738 [Paxillus involutus ATCC 200175]|uniref:F-box domain-containing protein n=1 Tax=Paxillus involutus ATCC 200175 TaxID=664439 RepID=A0A0C9U5M7_PAXIN|nr:hypothetical protein PAXINDRAFT_115738 [Paxillus involutus ATCC 200175]
MHRCLGIEEVQRAIFRKVNCLPSSSKVHRVTLARLARTCRAFNSSALDVLWERLESFTVLIQCLPQDLWRIDCVGRRKTFVRCCFRRPMSLKDWEIFYKYSNRVRCVLRSTRDGQLDWQHLGDDIIFALSNRPTPRPLIPCLRELHWDKSNKQHASLLHSLLTPSLDTLTLKTFGCQLRSPEVSILTSIGTVCPSLRTLRILLRAPLSQFLDTQGETVLSEAVLYLHSLESLVCPALDEAAIVHLSRLPRLSNLSMELRPDFKSNDLTSLAPPAFGSINDLTLTASSLETLTSFLELIQITPSRVSFTVAEAPTADALRLFFVVLVNACGSEQLSQVSLCMLSQGYAPLHPEPQATFSTFQPLLALPNIISFELDVPCAILLDDTGLTTLAKHWPILNKLSINPKSGWGPSNRITHQGLLNLLLHCPELSRFSFCVDFSDIDVDPEDLSDSRPGNGMTHDKCVSAGFLTSRIENPITIAAFLSDICPKLRSVQHSWRDDPAMSEEETEAMELFRKRWEEVEYLVPGLAAVRRQYSEWCRKETTVVDAASV